MTFGGGSVEGRFGIVREERAVRRDGQPMEEAVEPQRPGAGREVEEVGAFEVFDAFELGIHRESRFFASLRMTWLETPLDSGSRFARPE